MEARFANATNLAFPRVDTLGTFDEDFLAGRRSVGDPFAIIGAATDGLDPFAIRSGMNGHGITARS